ncbi:hypothetical protein ACIP5Y_24565 [Nocardia sp. NPDC088792]|uniref:hypothetical protein n=1 Tax=Nocardia sp. NPDC088792 TaxID=3364332 RepID=UPI003820AB8F
MVDGRLGLADQLVEFVHRALEWDGVAVPAIGRRGGTPRTHQLVVDSQPDGEYAVDQVIAQFLDHVAICGSTARLGSIATQSLIVCGSVTGAQGRGRSHLGSRG